MHHRRHTTANPAGTWTSVKQLAAWFRCTDGCTSWYESALQRWYLRDGKLLALELTFSFDGGARMAGERHMIFLRAVAGGIRPAGRAAAAPDLYMAACVRAASLIKASL
jgi:hypothetical protein